jgi:hypothetical protein
VLIPDLVPPVATLPPAIRALPARPDPSASPRSLASEYAEIPDDPDAPPVCACVCVCVCVCVFGCEKERGS